MPLRNVTVSTIARTFLCNQASTMDMTWVSEFLIHPDVTRDCQNVRRDGRMGLANVAV